MVRCFTSTVPGKFFYQHIVARYRQYYPFEEGSYEAVSPSTESVSFIPTESLGFIDVSPD